MSIIAPLSSIPFPQGDGRDELVGGDVSHDSRSPTEGGTVGGVAISAAGVAASVPSASDEEVRHGSATVSVGAPSITTRGASPRPAATAPSEGCGHHGDAIMREAVPVAEAAGVAAPATATGTITTGAGGGADGVAPSAPSAGTVGTEGIDTVVAGGAVDDESTTTATAPLLRCGEDGDVAMSDAAPVPPPACVAVPTTMAGSTPVDAETGVAAAVARGRGVETSVGVQSPIEGAGRGG